MTEKPYTQKELDELQEKINAKIKNRKKDVTVEDPGEKNLCDGCA